MERAIPDLYRVNEQGEITEAILDVAVTVPGSLMYNVLDVTIRCPFAKAHRRGTVEKAHQAARRPQVSIRVLTSLFRPASQAAARV